MTCPLDPKAYILSASTLTASSILGELTCLIALARDGVMRLLINCRARSAASRSVIGCAQVTRVVSNDSSSNIHFPCFISIGNSASK